MLRGLGKYRDELGHCQLLGGYQIAPFCNLGRRRFTLIGIPEAALDDGLNGQLLQFGRSLQNVRRCSFQSPRHGCLGFVARNEIRVLLQLTGVWIAIEERIEEPFNTGLDFRTVQKNLAPWLGVLEVDVVGRAMAIANKVVLSAVGHFDGKRGPGIRNPVGISALGG